MAATGNDGKEAIELYHQYHPDVLLMDIQMKEMSGLEAAEQYPYRRCRGEDFIFDNVFG